MPRAAFRALQGKWTIFRRIESALSTFPFGTLLGIAIFHPRLPISDKSDKTFNFEYLYFELGTLQLDNGSAMVTTQRKVYQYSEAEGELSIWFVKPESHLEVDFLFHNLGFVKPEEARTRDPLCAKAKHPYNQDMYWTEHLLTIRSVAFPELEIKHAVKSPSKDYVCTTKFARR